MDKLTIKQRKAINAILAAPSITAASRISGIAERTMRTWLTIPIFREALSDAQREVFQDAARMLTGLQESAIDTLNKEQVTGDTSQARIRAANLILEYGFKFTELTELDRRITELEKGVKNDT